tara:strand:- start:37 stop:1560 length:1524 start_codon:yes stop_codon:yes gene_type:complete
MAEQFGRSKADELAPALAAQAVKNSITIDPETGKKVYGEIAKRKGWGADVYNSEVQKGFFASVSTDLQEGMADISVRSQNTDNPLASFDALSKGLLSGLQTNTQFSPEVQRQVGTLVSTYRQDIIAKEAKKGVDFARADQQRNIEVTSEGALTFVSNGDVEAGAEAYLDVLDSYDSQVGSTYSIGEAEALKRKFTVEYEIAHSRLGLKNIIDEKGQIAGTQFIESIRDNDSLPWSLAEKEATVDVLTNDLKEIRTLENIKQSELAEGLKTRQADNASNYYIGIASGQVKFADLELAAFRNKISYTQLTTLGNIVKNQGKGVDDYELINEIRQAQYTNPKRALQLISDNTGTRLTGKTGSELYNSALGFQKRGGTLESAEAKRFSNHIKELVIIKGPFGGFDFESQANESKLQIVYDERVLSGESPAIVARELINGYKSIGMPKPQYAETDYENSIKEESSLFKALERGFISEAEFTQKSLEIKTYFINIQNRKSFQEDYDSIMKGQP